MSLFVVISTLKENVCIYVFINCRSISVLFLLTPYLPWHVNLLFSLNESEKRGI